jgi:hypothetical protein
MTPRRLVQIRGLEVRFFDNAENGRAEAEGE